MLGTIQVYTSFFKNVGDFTAANFAKHNQRFLNHKDVITSDSKAALEKNLKATMSLNQLNSADTWLYSFSYASSTCDGDVIDQSSYLTNTCIQGIKYSCDTGINSHFASFLAFDLFTFLFFSWYGHHRNIF